MKKFLFVLFVAATVFTGCKKDVSTVVNINAADLASVNSKLKGTWLFPMTTMNVLDDSGKPLTGTQYVVSPAMHFDGGSKVKIYQDIHTTLNGTYTLSADKGFVYLDVTYPDGTDYYYQLLMVDALHLKLVSTQPYVYYDGENPQAAQSVSNVVLKKQTASDVSGNLIRVIVKSDTAAYSVAVSVTHTRATSPADTLITLNSKMNIKGTYTYEFVAQSGDQLTVDIAGDYTKTTFYAFYGGVPMMGNIGYYFQEIKTTTGWIIP